MRLLRQLVCLPRMLQRLARLFMRRCMVLLAVVRRRGLMGMGCHIVKFNRTLSGYVHG